MPYVVSLLDKSPVAEGATAAQALETTVAFAQTAERLGYHRLWLAEHHGSPQLASSAPEIVVAHLLAATQRIRIGTGGVLLQHYSPFKLAEVFGTLGALAPGRVDLGIGKAPGGLPYGTRALQSEHGQPRRSFEAKLEELELLWPVPCPKATRCTGPRRCPARPFRRKSSCWAPRPTVRHWRRGWAGISPMPATMTAIPRPWPAR